MLDEMITAYGNRLLVAALGVALALLCLFIVLWLMRNRASSPFVRGGRNRQPRLQVLDAAAVDARRRIVLIRRDNVEHLVMIGGPTDIVIESGIGDDRAYLSALAVKAEASEVSQNLPASETARIVAAPSEPEAAVKPKPIRPVEAVVAAEPVLAEPEPIRSKPQPVSAPVVPAEPLRTTPQASAVTAPKAPIATGAQTGAAAPISVVPLTAASVAPVVAAATTPVMTVQATPLPPTPLPAVQLVRDEPQPIDPVRAPSAAGPAEVRPEPRLEVVASPVPQTPPAAIAPIVEPAQTATIQAPVEIVSPAVPTDAYASMAIVPEVSLAASHEPQFEQPMNTGRAPEVASIASYAVPDVPVIHIPSIDIASDATPARAPHVTAPDAANILEAARARVLPINATERPGSAQPFAAERFSPQHEPVKAAEKQEPPRDMSDFERVLEEEMALHLAADPLPLPPAGNFKGDSPMSQPFLPEIRSARPGLPISAVLPESRHATTPVAKPATDADAKPDEPNLQNEIARIFGEMSASRNS